MTDDATPAKVRLTEWVGPPLEDALKRAYYYTEAGEWRGPEVDEWDRWHAVAKVASGQDAAAFALKAVVNHWREFGLDHGFDECLEMAARVLRA